MAKLIVSSVGNATDSSFSGRDGNRIESTDVECVGTVDGNPSNFTIRIFGKNGASKIKAGVEANGNVSSFGDKIFYVVKKNDNPNLFSQSSGSYNKGRSSYSNESTALRLAVSIVELSSEKGKSPEEIADAVISIAKDKVLPFIVKSQQPIEGSKKSESDVVRDIIISANLADAVRSKGMTMSELLKAYEANGKSQSAFITAIKASLVTSVEDDEFEDDTPF